MQNIKTSSAKVARFVILFMTAAGFVAGLLPAYVAAKAVNLSLKPLDLTRSLSTEEIMAAGQLGGALYPGQSHEAFHVFSLTANTLF